MSRQAYGVILVPSTQHAIQIEKVLLEQKQVYKLIPVPRQIHSNCGVCIRIRRSDRDQILQILDRRGIAHEAYHEIE